MEVVGERIVIRKKYIVLLSGPMYDRQPLGLATLSPSRHQDYISPLHCVYPADTVMHESHERDNLCHFRGERERERKGNRERNENRSLWGCFVLSTALPSNQTNHLSWKSCRNSKILVVEGRKNVFMIVFFLFSSFCAECAF